MKSKIHEHKNQIKINVSKKNIILLGTLIISSAAYSQVGIDTDQPKATLDIKASPTSTTKIDGLIAPRVTGTELKNNDIKYTANQDGAIIYVTEALTTTTDKTTNVTSIGYYYFDKTQGTEGRWMKIANPTTPIAYQEPWNVQGGTTPATTNSQAIYQNNTVAIKKTTAISGADLDVAGAIRGGSASTSAVVGGNSIAVGSGAEAINGNTVALGPGAKAHGNKSVALGENATANKISGVAIGEGSSSDGTVAIAIGNGATTKGPRAIAIGTSALSTGNNSVAIGYTAKATGGHGFAIGQAAEAGGVNSIALGHQAKTSGLTQGSIAIGSGAHSSNTVSFAMGENAFAEAPVSYAIGSGAKALGTGETGKYAIGRNATASGLNSYAIGQGATATATGAYAVGFGSTAKYDNQFVVGAANIDADYRFGIGTGTGNALTVLKNAKMIVGEHSSLPSVGGETLHVLGSIKTAGNNYPDYVFEDYFTGNSTLKADYKFKSIYDTEKFIKENHHLPGVTSINELEKTENGYSFNITDLSTQTLEKVEELYLHTIEQQKQIDELKELVKTQQNQINQLLSK